MSASRWTSLAAIVAVACGAGDSGTRGIPDAGGKTFARLGVVLTVPRDGNATVGAVGRVVRYKGIDREGAQVLAGARDRDRAAVGRCAIVDDDARLDDTLATAPPDAAIQLLDAGELLVRVAGQTVTLAPRYVPEIVPFVTGVVYESEIQAQGGLDASGTALLAAFGGRQVGSFVAPAEVPAAPRLLVEGGSVESGADLPVAWTGDGSGTVSLVVSRESGPALRCHVADSGRFTIPGAMLARVVERARGEGVALAVERSRKTAFSAPGLDAAEVEVTVRDLVTLSVE